jgi:peptidoglycan/LPS O-acetylase OafA/YrhL
MNIRLKDIIDTTGRANNLDALRLFAAVFVIMYHCFLISNLQVGSVGIWIFFIISGFLITQSYCKNSNPIRFLWSRCLRIFPALFVMLMITMFVIGAFVTKLSIGNYFTNINTYSYLQNISLYARQLSLPSVSLAGFAELNVPLWSLCQEFTFYFLVLGLGMIGVLFKKRIIILGIFVASLITSLFAQIPHTYFFQMDLSLVPTLLTYFSLGMTAYLYREYIRISRVWMFVALFATVVMEFVTRTPTVLFSISLTYLILYLGYTPNIKLSVLTKFGDYSYGLYIWGFMVQLLIMQAFKNINPFLLFGSTLIGTYIIAGCSWHLIEKRALKLKNYHLEIYKTKAKLEIEVAG